MDEVIEGFKTHNFYNQNRALNNLCTIPLSDIDKNRLFLIGRNILQAAIGGAYECGNFFQHLTLNLARYNKDGENHLLNGILFEIYFNSEGKFREGDFKSGLVDEIFRLQTATFFKSSFEFINTSSYAT